MAYGTHSDVDGAGAVITISGETDTYLLHFAGIDQGKYFATDAYVDEGDSNAERYTTWSFESVSIDGYTNVYRLKANKTNAYLYWANSSGNPWCNETWLATDATGNNAYWLLIRKVDREAYANASLTNFIDATWRITNPDFEGYNYGNGKEIKLGWTGGFAQQSSVQASYSGMFCEKYSGEGALANFTESQTLSGLPKGKYRLTISASAQWANLANPPAEITGAYIFAGEQTTPVSTMQNYYVDFTATGSDVQIGFKTVSTTANWVSFDNVRLAYIDPAVSIVATDFISGVAMTAGQWYKFTPSVSDTYTLSVTSNITYTTDDAHLSSEDGSALSSSMELTTGTTYYFKSSTTQVLSISATTALPTPSSLVSNGWSEVTSTADLANSDYYYVFYSVEGINLMMAEGIVTGYHENKNTMFYQTATDPMSDRTEVWTIEYDELFKYGVRNLNNPTKYMQSRGGMPYYVQFEWETAQRKWTRFNFAYADGSWTIENNACDTENPDTYFSNYFIGPWNTQSFFNGSAVAGNKKGSDVGHFKIYRKLKEAYDNSVVYENKQLIIANSGDITSLINGEFTENTDGWTGGSRVTGLARSWRSSSVENPFMERGSNGTMSCTLNNMPAGTYKVVAASRAAVGCKITPQIAGTSGETLTGVGDQQSATTEINLNGVQMPYSSLGGFTTNDYGHNWQWITATGTLASDGDLVISFNCEGTSWMPIDDVHLYCTELDGTSYTRTVGDGKGTINTSNHVVTADITVSNPNTVLRTTGAITTAAGEQMNNDQYNSSRITKLVLYDGYEFTKLTDEVGADHGAILYRSIPADTWCTLTVPFWPTTSLTMKCPSSLSEGTLTFSDINKETWGGVDKPMLVKSTTALTAIEGKLASTNGGGSGVNHGDMTSGSGVPMVGVYTSGYVPESTGNHFYYVVGTDNYLHKVTGDGVLIKPFRAYFDLNNESGANARNVLSMNFDNESSGIGTLINKEKDITGSIYDLSGRIIAKDQLPKGLYIVKGKKVIVK